MIGLVSLLWHVSLSSAASPDRTAFLQRAENWVPEKTIRVVFEGQGNRSGRTVAAIDPVSGAWLNATQVTGVARALNGKVYRVLPDTATTVEVEQANSMWGLGYLIPQAFITALVETPSIVKEATLEGSIWTLRCTQPGSEVLGDAFIRVDDTTGRVLSFELENPEDRRRMDFNWEGTDVGVAVYADKRVPASDRVSVEWDVPASMFQPASLEAEVAESRVIVDKKLQAIASGYRQEPDGTWTPPPAESQTTVPFSNGLARYRTPLILGGLIVVGLATAHIIRRRTA